MPRKNRGRKNKKGKKRPRKNFNKARALTTVTRGVGFADMTYVKLTYVQQFTMTPPIGAVPSTQVFRANSCFDPDFSLGGHQPLYFDQYSQVYDKYRVLGCSIKVDALTPSATNGMYLVVFPSTISVGLSDTLQSVYEQQRAGAPVFTPIARRRGTRIKKYASTRQVMGVTKSQMYGDEYAARTVNNPTNEWYWNLLAEPDDGAAVSQILYVVVKLVMYVQFYDRLIAAQS